MCIVYILVCVIVYPICIMEKSVPNIFLASNLAFPSHKSATYSYNIISEADAAAITYVHKFRYIFTEFN